MESSVYILAGLLGVAVIIVAFFFGKSRRSSMGDPYEALRAELNATLVSNMNMITAQMRDLSMTVNGQLSSVTTHLSEQSGQIGRRMDSAARMMGDVQENLGALSKATAEMTEIGRDISGLEAILGAPKPRGGFGEFMLGELLASVLPKRYYELQYTFKNGRRVDGVVRLTGGLLSVDSKFPLENFSRLLSAENETERIRYRKKFLADCRSHLDTIAASYILPEEGTLDFALMYVPAENVYYEMVLRGGAEGGLMEYAFGKKVIPVSPNTFYLYLQTILMGLKGFEISERTGEILKGLNRLNNDFAEIIPDLDTLGRHLGNAVAKHGDMAAKVRGFEAVLSRVATGEGAAPSSTTEEDVTP